VNKNKLMREYFSFLVTNKLKPEQLILGAGGACLMHGLRETTEDLDLILTDVVMLDEFLHSGRYPVNCYGTIHEHVQWNGVVSLHRPAKVETHFIQGICCYTPKQILIQKQILNRQKDQEDIVKLKALIKRMALQGL
jgi:hypothetical protein